MVDLFENFLKIHKLFLAVASNFKKIAIPRYDVKFEVVKEKRKMADQLQPIRREMGGKG
jgi:hypothetical protein